MGLGLVQFDFHLTVKMSTTTTQSKQENSVQQFAESEFVSAYRVKATSLLQKEMDLTVKSCYKPDQSEKAYISVPDKMYDSVLRKLRKSSEVTVLFHQDKYPTVFRKVDKVLLGFDPEFPEGRKVMKESKLDTSDMAVHSVKGFLAKHLKIYNNKVEPSMNTNMSAYFMSLSPPPYRTVRGLMFCGEILAFLLWVHETGIELRSDGETLGVAIPKKPDEDTKNITLVSQWTSWLHTMLEYFKQTPHKNSPLDE